MGILNSFARYLRTRGRLLYSGLEGFPGKGARRRKKGGWARSEYMQIMEPRMLMTTLYGGESFRYVDSQGNNVTATLTGNVIAELVAAKQVGGGVVNRVTTGGYLIFGDISGAITSGPRAGLIIGNGSLPVTLGTQSTASTKQANLNYTSNQINYQSLVADNTGRTFTFNAYDTDNRGQVVQTAETPNQAIWTFQIVQLDTSTGAPTVVLTVNSNDTAGAITPIIPLDAKNAQIPVAAYNPIDGKIYFEVDYSLTATNGSNSVTTYTNEIFSYSVAGQTVTDVGPVNLTTNADGLPVEQLTGMTFTVNDSAPTFGRMYLMVEPVTGGTTNATLQVFSVATNGTNSTVNPAVAVASYYPTEGFGTARTQLRNVAGLSSLPGTVNDGTGSGYLFALVTNGAASHVVRLDLTPAPGTYNNNGAIANGGPLILNGVSWGDTTDLAESLNARNPGTYSGRAMAGFAYNPVVVDPFTGLRGAWMALDTSAHTVSPQRGVARGDDLLFINHQFHISAGDVFSIYSNMADMNAVIAFQGTNLYGGNSGDLGSDAGTNDTNTNTSPANSGTVYIGFRGQIPDNSTNDTVIASAPFLSGQLTSGVGIVPGQVVDTTDPTITGLTTRKLFAGLTVTGSLEETFAPTTSLLDGMMGGSSLGTFSHITGLAVSPDGTIVVVNSNITTVNNSDQLALIDPTTGFISTLPVDVTLVNNTTTKLQNVEALAYGDPNLTGTASLYAVYDLHNGNGPTLGTINYTGLEAIFTPIAPLNLGSNAQVSAIAFTPGGTSGDPSHQSVYVIADPNRFDNNTTQSLYQVNMTLGTVLNAPGFDAAGNVVTNGGIGLIMDYTGNGLTVVAAFFDTQGRLIVDDKNTGSLMDVNLTTGASGLIYRSAAGTVNPTVAGIALDPNTLNYIVADNLTGFAGVGSTANTTTSSIMMKLRSLDAGATPATSLGKFLLDGTMTGKVTITGSMELFYAGYLITGDATSNGTGHGSWRVAPSFGDHTGVDNYAKENYFKNNFYIGGDIRDVVVLSNIGTNGANMHAVTEIVALGKIGTVYAGGNMEAVVHAGNQDNVPSAVDSNQVLLQAVTDTYGFTYRGSASVLSLTDGGANEVGSVFTNNPQPIDNFTASFSVTVTPTLVAAADGGFAFVLQNQGIPALGAGGTGVGYQGILRSAALVFRNDPVTGTSSFGLATNGNFFTTTVLNTINFAIGDLLTVNMSYNGSTLTVDLEDGSTFTNYTASFAINLANVLGAHSAYVGFTGSTGTSGSATTLSAFVFNGGIDGQVAFAQQEIQKYTVNTDWTFAGGYLINNGNNAPFANNSLANAQYLGSVRNAASGQANVIHITGTLDDAPTSNGNPLNNPTDYYAFSVLAGQTITVQARPRTDTVLLGAFAEDVFFTVYDPDGNQIASDNNWYNYSATMNRAVQFTADRPGVYRVQVSPVVGGANISYDLLISGQGVGDTGVGAVVAGGNIALPGSYWTRNSTYSSDKTTNPSIWSDTGDVGAIVAGGQLTASAPIIGLTTVSAVYGSVTTGSSSQDIFVPHGNLRVVQATTIGVLNAGRTAVSGAPDIDVSGTVGLLATTNAAQVLVVNFSKAVGGNIQVIDAAGDLGGYIRTNKAIGVIRAGSVSNWWVFTEFQVNADNANSDGIIDLIDVTGNWGQRPDTGGIAGGAPIITHTGGNVRFMRVGGLLWQDTFFGTTTSNDIIHTAGVVTVTDDSGANIILDPGATNVAANGTNPATTGTGTITTREYAVRGAGGKVILAVTSTAGLTMDVEAGASGRTGEIAEVTVAGTGQAVTPVNGIPTINATTGSAVDVIMMSKTGAVASIFEINGGTIDHVQQKTNGDVIIVNAGDIGTVESTNNIGLTGSTTGAALIPQTPLFSSLRYFGVNAGHIGTLTANKAIGNVTTSGVVGSILPNADGIDDPNTFEGLVGFIQINGTAAGATSGTETTAPAISVTRVDLGEGMPGKGTAGTPRTGLSVSGRIVSLTGTNADIRGDISASEIQSIALTNGSIVNVSITASNAGTSTIESPTYAIQSININGNGGIIASSIFAPSINNIVVGPAGFGILNSIIYGATDFGTINNVTAGGWGIRYTSFQANRINNIAATSTGVKATDGAPIPVSSFSPRMLVADTYAINPYDSAAPNYLTDLTKWYYGDGAFGTLDTYGSTSGVLGSITVVGHDRLGTINAYDLDNSEFAFPNSIGTLTVRHNVNGAQFTSGAMGGINVTNDATNLEVTIAGTIGPVKIGGNFGADTTGTALYLSQILAKGPNGNIASFTEQGNFNGLLQAEGTLGVVTIGKAGTALVPSTGDMSGTIIVGGNHLTTTVLNSLKIYGSVSGGLIRIGGNTGTIDIAHDLGGLQQPLTISGNLTSLILGSDAATSSIIGAPVQISGNLGTGAITGQLTSQVIVAGNVTKFTLVGDTASAGLDLMSTSSALTVGGTLASLAVSGGVAGSITAGFISAITTGTLTGSVWGGRGIASAIVTGGVLAGASVNSGLGTIAKLNVTGNIDGAVTAPNGAITALTLTGGIGATGTVSARSMGAITVPGAVAGTISGSTSFTSLKAGSIVAGANISSPNLGSVTTTGDLGGILNIGSTALAAKVVVGRDFSGTLTAASPLTMTVARNVTAGAVISDSNALSSLIITGSMSGDVFVDRTIATFSAASLTNSVITAGLGIGTFTVKGAMASSLVQVGLARGFDRQFGTGDIGEQGRMADLTTFNVGTMSNSIVAVGGNIGTYKATGTMTGSSVSAGLVLDGAAIAAVIADATPLADSGERNAARQDAQLLHGTIKSGSVGTTTTALFSSDVTAGVSPGADGAFGTADDAVNTSVTGGDSAVSSFKGLRDGSSHLLANTPGGGATVLSYTTDGSSTSILGADPISGSPTATATPGSPAIINSTNGTITITVTGAAGASVRAYDDIATTDRLDTLLITGPTNSAITVVVTTSTGGTFELGRVIATDGTKLANFSFNGDILGDINGGPALWIDSDMVSFSVRNLPNDGTWSGQIGGNVSKLTINQAGPGQLRIGGRVQALTVSSSVGNPLVQQLGTYSGTVDPIQLAYDSTTGQVYATDGTNLLNVDITTGTVNSSTAIVSALGNGLTITGLTVDASGRLIATASLNNQNPVISAGAISAGDHLRGMAVDSQGRIFAIDSITGVDQLVRIDPATGAETVVGTVKDFRNDTYSQNILALAFDASDRLFALVDDADGSGASFTTSSGVALARINYSGSTVVISHPNSAGQLPKVINGAVTADFTAMAVDAAGNIYAVERSAGVDQLTQLTLSGTTGTATVAINAIGAIKLDAGATDTALTGIGFDEQGNLLGMSVNSAASTSELISVSTVLPGLSVRVDVAGLISQAYAGFAVGKSGAQYTTYAFTTDDSTGGTLFASPGVVNTLGVLGTDGVFSEMMPVLQDGSTPLAGNILSIADDGSGTVYVITDRGILAAYNDADGSLIGGAPLGTVRDAHGAALSISHVSFDQATGDLVGLSTRTKNLVKINTTTIDYQGASAVLASNLTDIGTADDTDLTALAYSTSLGQFIGFSSVSGNFVALLGTTPDSLGGIIANSFGAVTLPATYGSRIHATGNGAASAIDSVKFTGTGTFRGNITSDGSIGTVAGTGITFAGALVADGDIAGVSLSGTVDSAGIFSSGGSVKSLVVTGPFAGTLFADRATTLTINGSMAASAIIAVVNSADTVTVTGVDAGTLLVGGNKTLKTGVVDATGSIEITGDAGVVSLGGVNLGGLFLADQGATSITVGGTIAGVVATRRSVTTATLANLSGGVFAVGGDLATLTVNGTVSSSLITSGVWIGDDGVYNTSDDVIFGGSINTAKFNSSFIDSMLVAGVLPREGVDSVVNHIPSDHGVFDYNGSALLVEGVDGAQAGGIARSSLLSVTFAKPVVSTNTNGGVFSALVAADSLGKITGTGSFKQIVRNDPLGAPAIATVTDATTGLTSYNAIRYNTNEVRIVFTQPLDSATLNATTIHVYDFTTGVEFTGLSFDYFTQVADDGTTQGVVQIISNTNYNNATGLKVVLSGGTTAPTITDRTGLRSSLLDYNQDGVVDAAGDPFGTQFAGQTLYIGTPSNDNFASAATLTGFPVSIESTNINATVEAAELLYYTTSGASVWYSWTPTVSGPVSISTAGSTIDTVLNVYTGTDLGGLLLVGTNDNVLPTDTTSLVQFNAVAGQTYKISIGGSSVTGTAQTGVFTLSIGTASVPANDDIANAVVLSGSTVTASGSTFLATSQFNEPVHAYGTTNSIWYAWTAPSTGLFDFNTFTNETITSVDVFTSSSTAPTMTTLSSAGTSVSYNEYQVNAVAGTTYYIALDSNYGLNTGTVQLNILPANPPINDNFANAINLAGRPTTVIGTNLFSTPELNEPAHVSPAERSVWFSWTAPTSGLVQVDTIGSTFDTTLSVYVGSTLTSLTIIGSNDQSGGNNTSLLQFNAVAGQVYKIAIDGWYGDVGTYTLHII